MPDVTLVKPLANYGCMGGINMLEIYARELNFRRVTLTVTERAKTSAGVATLRVTHSAVTNLTTAMINRPFVGQVWVISGVDPIEFDGTWVLTSVTHVSSTQTDISYQHWKAVSISKVTGLNIQGATPKWAFHTDGLTSNAFPYTNWNSQASDTGFIPDPEYPNQIGANKVLKMGRGYFRIKNLANYIPEMASLYDNTGGFVQSFFFHLRCYMLCPGGTPPNSLVIALISGNHTTNETWHCFAFNSATNAFNSIWKEVITSAPTITKTALVNSSMVGQNGVVVTFENNWGWVWFSNNTLSVQDIVIEVSIQNNEARNITLYSNGGTIPRLMMDLGQNHKIQAPIEIGFGLGDLTSGGYFTDTAYTQNMYIEFGNIKLAR